MTRTRILETLARVAIGGLAVFAPPLTNPVAAQGRPGLAMEFSAGWIGFADDGIANERVVGGTVRWYVLPRVSVGPEIAHISGDNHSHLMVTGNVTCDLLSPVNGGPRRVNPFVVAGGGLFQTRENFFTGPFTSTEGAFTAGGGVRAVASDRVTIGVDARIGWELHVRVAGLVGVQLGR